MTAQRIVNVTWPVVLLLRDRGTGLRRCGSRGTTCGGRRPHRRPPRDADHVPGGSALPHPARVGNRHDGCPGAGRSLEVSARAWHSVRHHGRLRHSKHRSRSDDDLRLPGSQPRLGLQLPCGDARGTHVHGALDRPVSPCVAEGGTYTSRCDTPNAPVDVLTRSVTVDFQRQNLALGKPVTASGKYPGTSHRSRSTATGGRIGAPATSRRPGSRSTSARYRPSVRSTSESRSSPTARPLIECPAERRRRRSTAS